MAWPFPDGAQRTTFAPAPCATAAVVSVEPSSTTMTSPLGLVGWSKAASAVAMTPAMVRASLRAGMQTAIAGPWRVRGWVLRPDVSARWSREGRSRAVSREREELGAGACVVAHEAVQ